MFVFEWRVGYNLHSGGILKLLFCGGICHKDAYIKEEKKTRKHTYKEGFYITSERKKGRKRRERRELC